VSCRDSARFVETSPDMYSRGGGRLSTFVIRRRPQNAKCTRKNCLTTSVHENVLKSSYSASGWC
jgi:hypothetical protein